MLVKLYKMAYHLDLQGKYDGAQAIEDAMVTLSERVGLTTQDMVSLADYFDEIGDEVLASSFDEMLKSSM